MTDRHIEPAGELSLRLDLLDLQVVDADHLPIGRVDDAELELPGPGERPRVTTLLCGQASLGQRLGGLLGGALTGIAVRLTEPGQHDGPGLRFTPAEITAWGSMLTLRSRLDDLDQAAGLERWLARHIVAHIPGSRR